MGISPTSPMVSTGAKKSQLFCYGFIFFECSFHALSILQIFLAVIMLLMSSEKKAIITFYSLCKLFLNFFWRLFIKLLVT